MTRDRLRKGDRIVVATRPIFAVGAPDLIPVGTTGTVTRGGRWDAQVVWDTPDRHGNPTCAAATLPYVTQTVQRAGQR